MKTLPRQWLVLVATLGLFLAGCGGGAVSMSDPVNPPRPWQPGDAGTSLGAEANQPSGPTTQGTNMGPRIGSEAVLGVGDLIKVTFSDVNPPPPFHEERIRDDGNLTLPLNIVVRAVGRNAGELQKAIHDEYVPKYYKQLTVTVRTEDRVYFVGGEVRSPSRQLYTTRMSVLRAIDTAGGFTEFAKRDGIELHRVNGQKVRINYKKARKNPALDPEVFPGDRVEVPARRW